MLKVDFFPTFDFKHNMVTFIMQYKKFLFHLKALNKNKF